MLIAPPLAPFPLDKGKGLFINLTSGVPLSFEREVKGRRPF